MKWPWLPPDTPETRGEPGDPHAAIRMINRFGSLRTQIGGDDCALWVIDSEDDRWLKIDWDGNITTGRIGNDV